MEFFYNFREEMKQYWVIAVWQSRKFPDGARLLCYTFIA
jgi:hypothetical protein